MAEYQPVAGYAAPMPELVGWGEPQPVGYADYGDYAEPDYAGYVREVPPIYNAGCAMPTNVAGYDEAEFSGYTRPAEVSPSCAQFTPQPGPSTALPPTFQPLW